MLRYYNGTVFNSGATWLVNTVNCMGVMGAGIALEFRLRYPEMFVEYKNLCLNKMLSVGHVSYYENVAENSHIVNFPTKLHYKYPSQIQWIEQGLKDFVATYKSHNIDSIAFSKLGCGKGGLDWNVVKPLMEKYLANLDADIIICLDVLNQAEGKEKQMVEAYNHCDVCSINSFVRLNSKQLAILEDTKPITRFFTLASLPGIGAATYERIFQYFYKEENNQATIQLSFL